VQSGPWSDILRKHPFLLPNLLAAMISLIGMVAVALFVHETLPKERRRSAKYMLSDATELYRKCMPGGARYQSLRVLKEHESDVDFCDSEAPENDEKADETVVTSHVTMCSLMSRRQTRVILMVHWLYSFVSQARRKNKNISTGFLQKLFLLSNRRAWPWTRHFLYFVYHERQD